MTPSSQQPLMAGSVEARVFGSVALMLDGVEIELGRRQVQRLVAALACRSGRTVSVDRLIDHLWSDGLPVKPRQALNVALSRLRTALGGHASRLESDGSGYRLVLDAVDADTFERLIGEARDLAGREAVDQLAAALELWTDDPFAGDPDADMFAPRRASLDETRRTAVTRLVELLSELGDHARAVEVATPFVGDGAVRERFVIAHATALARSGRKADALAAVASATSRLRNELGLEPSAALLAAERSILSGAVDLSVEAPRAIRPVVESFVGRSRELAALGGVRRGIAVTVVGEAGMGKSTLLDHYVSTVDEQTTKALRIDVPENPDRPLGALSLMCSQLVDRFGIEMVRPTAHSTLARLCPELGLVAESSLTRDAMIVDLVEMLESVAETAVLIVDDAHLLDGVSGEVFEQLVRRGRSGIVFGTRPTENPRLQFLVGSEPAGGSASTCAVLQLEALSATDAAELMEKTSSRRLGSATAEHIHGRSGGNALFLRLLIERWADGGSLDGDLPSSVLVSVSERLAVLSGAMRQSLDVAAVLGRTFSMPTLRGLRPNADVELEAVEAAGLLILDSTDDSGQFVHALVAEVCYDLLPVGRRVALHDEIGRVIEWTDGSPAEFAPHHVAAAQLDPSRAIASSIAAAAQFAEGFDWHAALGHLEAAAAVAREYRIGDPDVTAQIVVRRGVVGRALILPGYLEDLLAGCEAARVAGNQKLFVVAVTELCGHGKATTAGTADNRVLKLLDEALELDMDPADRAELCASAMPLFSTSELAGRGRALYREAWDLARGLGDPEVEAAVVAHAHMGFAHPDDFELLVEAADRMRELAGSDPEMVWESAFVRFQCSSIVGDAAATAAALEEMRAYLPLATRRPRNFGLAFSESAYAALTGDFDAAERFAEEAYSIGVERFDPSWATSIYGLLLLTIRTGQGRSGELGDAIAMMMQDLPDYLPFRSAAAFVAINNGDRSEARRHLDVVARDGFANLVKDVGHTSVLVAAARAAAAVGTTDEIAALIEMLFPFSGKMSWNGVATMGPVDEALALLADACGDHEVAGVYRAAALELAERFRPAIDSTP